MMALHRAKRGLKHALTKVAQRYNQSLPLLSPALWDLQVHEGRLRLEGLDLARLTERWGSPLHVVHAAALRRNADSFLDAEGEGPPCEVYYSYKTNPIPAVLRILHERGIGAEVISEFEWWLALRLGVDPSRIVYNGPVKSDASLREAISRDIGLLNANHREEIARIASIAAAVGKRPRVGVRVSTSGSWSGQFGAPIATGEALRAVREACQNPHLRTCALHVHLGAPITNANQVCALLGEVLEFAEVARADCGLDLQILDLGGSLSVSTVTPLGARAKRLNMTFLADLAPPAPEAMLTVRAYVRLIRRLVADHCRALGRPVPRLFLEPGRAMTGNTQFLIATVQAIKSGDGAAPFAVLDAGINLAQSVQSEYHQIFHATRMHVASRRSYRVAGPICSPGDVLYWACSLPELSVGDPLVIADAGAYFVPFATSFSFPQPGIVLVDGGEVSLIRRAERFEDLISYDDI